ncbi:ABC transporter permease [Pollutimonas bauzanensis]|uniref:Peptide/nickel transport system permease protein n=1 Tax=Pollutimonas bauzanensis TaxID=658167 RepID=A0A1M5SMH8_9BURK|nr:ABC transporter permease [Pollutimonas bauzanensis]SHH39660.1 peptide/nickel transport system permease protein [Pollutimonas bauzanensis]
MINTLLLRRALHNRMLVTGAVVLLALALMSALAPWVAAYDPYDLDPIVRLKPPSAEHWFGTDGFGRDVFARVMYGIRISLSVGAAVAFCSGAIGVVVGLTSAYYKVVDHIAMRVCDGLYAFPSLLLAIAIVAALGPATGNVIAALSLVYIPSVARIARAAALVVKEKTYIEGLRAQGAGAARIIWLHMLPNVTSPLIVQTTFIFAVSILTEAALSFLGAGIPAPTPSLGNLLLDGKNVIFKAWWMTVFPGVTVILMILALNILGDGLRDFLDPHIKTIPGRSRRLLRRGAAADSEAGA